MDFYTISTREKKGGDQEVYPSFLIGRSKDLMVRGRSFYAIWDDAEGLWSTDEFDVQRLVDDELIQYAKEHGGTPKLLKYFDTGAWEKYRNMVRQISDNAHQLDNELTFSGTTTKRGDYASKRLPYRLEPGDHSAWDELTSVLYSPEELAKIEWAIGAVVAGDSKKIQKFLVFYGAAGTGKSTIMGIIEKLFTGYITMFEAKALGSNNGTFATEVFKSNPLVAIQHDGDLSKIDDNTRLNSIISHETMTMHEKYKASYDAKVNAFLFMGTNQPVKISDSKSGIIRRLIDVNPTGEKIHPQHYKALMDRINFELGAIAHHCLEVYRAMGKNYYNTYQPLEMMFQTDVFFNFIESKHEMFRDQDFTTLKQAYSLYKEFCTETGIERALPMHKVRSELQGYFNEFHQRIEIDGQTYRSYYSGFKGVHFKTPAKEDPKQFSLVMEDEISIFDREYEACPAQGAKEDGTPQQRWANVKTTLAEIDTHELHYVQVPDHHIVIDFDLKGDDGAKSLEKNLEAASSWPPTYGELSKSGCGVHLHYRYVGDVSELSGSYAEGIEVKVFTGNSSLRRRLSRCNNVPISEISTGLPLKEKKVLDIDTMHGEKALRDLINRNLRKEIHPGTKPSIDFIKKILDDAYAQGMTFDVTDLRSKILAFANGSTNQANECFKIVLKMRWKSDEPVEAKDETLQAVDPAEPLVFFDVEVYPNLFVICWKYAGADQKVNTMINPSPLEVEALLKMKLVGFNNRRYDNHILWARMLGYNNERLYKLSKSIIDNNVGALFGEAYKVSWTDIYDFSSKKQSLKKFQVELGIFHMELDLPWDEEVKFEDFKRVAEYCANDTLSTEAVFEARKGDFAARQILAELSGLTVNDTTQKHTAKIIFGDDRNPQREFVYTKLATEFPGYEYNKGVSTYQGEIVGEGGYVYAEPGIYEDVALLDVASMHPTSIRVLNAFGRDYTRNFAELVDARLAIKNKDLDAAGKLLGGRLQPYLADPDGAKALSDALKIVINIVYGLTSAKFDNPFRDLRNVDNIVAKRGALFMIDLKRFVQDRGFTVAHIKTDSIKIPNATPEIIEEVKQFGEKYGYMFEYKPEQDHYKKLALVNDAVYVCQHDDGSWDATGAQFAHPYVFKELFDRDSIISFDDYCETKQVSQGTMYLDFDAANKRMEEHGPMHHVGRTGRFVPVKEGYNGGILYRVKDGKNYAVTGTKGFLWLEAEQAKIVGEDCIDMIYFERLKDEAIKTIEKFGSFADLVR